MDSQFPPFYKGQKVVCIEQPTNIGRYNYEINPEKGKTYTIRHIEFVVDCWAVHLVEIVNETHLYRDFYGNKIIIECGFDSKFFSPIIENFESVSFEKVMEEELVSQN